MLNDTDNYLDQMGLSITFLYNTYSTHTGGQVYENRVYEILLNNLQIKLSRYICNPPKGIFKILAPIINCFKLWTLRKQNVIFINSSHTLYFTPFLTLLKLFTSTKIIVFHHHYIHLQFNGLKRWVYKLGEMAVLSVSNYIIAPSPYIVKLNEKRFKNKTIFWPSPFPSAKDYTSKPRAGELLYVGTIEQRKGLVLLINSLIWLKKNSELHYKLTIIGKVVEEGYYQNLKKLITQNNLDVVFSGYVTEKEKCDIFRQNDIFVFPSLLEGYGMVLWEAMSFGLPIICFNNSAMPYSVTDGVNGYIIPNKNYEEFAKKIDLLSRDREARNKIGNNSFLSYQKANSVEKFTQQVLVDIKNILRE